MDDPEVQSLIHQARCGDANAWDRLFELCQSRLLHDAQRLLGPCWHAMSPRDLVQETWARAIAGIESYQGAGYFSWLSVIMRNAHRNFLRDPRRGVERLRVTLPVPDTSDATGTSATEPVSLESSALQALLKQEKVLLVRQALADLDPELRNILEIWMIERGLSLNQIAKRLDLTPKVVRARFHEGIAKLRHKLRDVR